MYYNVYIPWAINNKHEDKLDPEDIDWYYNDYLKSKGENKQLEQKK